MVSIKAGASESSNGQSGIRFPKVLFVNEVGPDDMAMCSVARQMLVGYPKERLSWWYCLGTSFRGISSVGAHSLHRFWLPPKLLPNRKLKALRGSFLERIWAPLAARHLAGAVASARPDVVWVLLWSWPILVANRTRWPKGIRLHVSLMDFPDTVGCKAIMGLPRSGRFREAVFKLIGQADSWDAISKAMLDEIRSKTGRRDGIVLHPGLEPEDLQALEDHQERPADGGIRLAYVGSILCERPFIELVKTLEKLRPQLPRKLVLEFYGNRGYRNSSWFNPEWMIEHKVFRSDRELVVSLQGCSWGTVVMDPDGTDLQYSRFSFPGKTGPYLSAGVPLLGIGHPSSSLADLMQRHQVGVFQAVSKTEELEPFLRESLQMPNPRLAFRNNILECARNELNAAQIRARLWQVWAASPPQDRAPRDPVNGTQTAVPEGCVG